MNEQRTKTRTASVTRVEDIIVQAKRLCDDLEELTLEARTRGKSYGSYDRQAAERELRYLKHLYVRIRGTTRGFPNPVRNLERRARQCLNLAG